VTTRSPTGAIGLLQRAIGYTLGSLDAITPDAMWWPTPCREWDLRTLMEHVNDSLAVLHEAVGTGHVALDFTVDDGDIRDMGAGDPVAGPVADLHDRAYRLLDAWAAAQEPAEAHDGVFMIGDCPIMADVVAVTGAVEVAVHGWDIYRACGLRRPIPHALAIDLLEVSPLLVADADRPGRFAAPVSVSPRAGPGDRLIAFLGRDPS
jgi:uncharacterized protein (TIGR03086 family)